MGAEEKNSLSKDTSPEQKKINSFFGHWGPGSYIIFALLLMMAVLPHLQQKGAEKVGKTRGAHDFEKAVSVMSAKVEKNNTSAHEPVTTPSPDSSQTLTPEPSPTLTPEPMPLIAASPEPTPTPEPLVVTVQVGLPEIQPSITPGQRAPVLFTFSGFSGARHRLGSQLVENLPQISPTISGRWFWEASNRLRFEPQDNWPAGQMFRVNFPENFLGDFVIIKNPEISFWTPPFSATWTRLSFVDDPENPEKRYITANVQFTYPVSAEDVRSALRISTIPEEKIFSAPPENFTIEMSANDKEATITTTPVALPQKETFVVFELDQSLREQLSSANLGTASSGRVMVPTAFSLFQIEKAELVLVENANPLLPPDQLLTLTTSANASGEKLLQYIELLALPRDRVSDNGAVEPEFDWVNSDQVTAESLQQSKKIPLTHVPSGLQKNTTHTYKFAHRQPGALLLNIKRGAPSAGGYLLANDFKRVLQNTTPDPLVRILPDGGLLSLSGERKISIAARGTTKIGIEVARLQPGQVQHLVTQTGGRFQDPTFQSWNFTRENITTIFSSELNLPAGDNYQSQLLDISLDELFSSIAEEERKINQSPANTAAQGENQKRSRIVPVRGARLISASPQSLDSNDKPTQRTAPTTRAVGMFFLRIFDTTPNKYGLTPPSENLSNRWSYYDEEEGYYYSGDDFTWIYDEKTGQSKRVRLPANSSRFLLITDFGIIAKENADGSRQIFLQSLAKGEPIANATVFIISKNGSVIASAKTDSQGQAHVGGLDGLSRDKEPVAYLVTKGDDIAFLPYSKWDRRLDFSRFDVGGAFIDARLNLDAFVFCERGIFRPGEDVRFAVAVRRLDWTGDIAGIPLRVRVTNAQGEVIHESALACTRSGLMDMSFPTQKTTRSGPCRITVGVPHGEKDTTVIGSASFLLQDFQPDSLRVLTQISPRPEKGLPLLGDTEVEVTLQNLYGGFPEGRRVTAKYNSINHTVTFPEYPGYYFGYWPESKDPTYDTWELIELDEAETDNEGKARFSLENIPHKMGPVAAIRLLVEGFEADGGRSVPAELNIVAAQHEKLLGVLPPQKRDFLEKNQPAELKLIAITPDLAPATYENLTCTITEIRTFYTLNRRGGYYYYDQVRREIPQQKTTLNITGAPITHKLKTDTPGHFQVTITNQDGVELTKMHYTVTGWDEAQSYTETSDAELRITLDKKSYEPGDIALISLQAPYPGPGLITIEGDRVLHHQWFRATTTNSIQKLRIPSGVTGQLYLNVALSRAPGDETIHLKPLAYAIAPITIGKKERALEVDIAAPERSLPGEKITIEISAREEADAILYAVDEGILNITGYRTPNPLEHAFRKYALQTGTLQTLDLVLPEASLFQRLAAAGGDGEAEEDELLDMKVNPFSRRIPENAIFWSGVTKIGPKPTTLQYTPPASFSGTLRIMAVAVNNSRLSDGAQRETLVRGPVVIEPNVPLFASPGDSLQLSVTLNRDADSLPAHATPVKLTLTSSDHIKITQPPPADLTLAPGQEIVVPFRATVNNLLGAAEIRFEAAIGREKISTAATLSVRPPTPRVTRVRFSRYDGDDFTVDFPEKIHTALADVAVSLSATPLGLATGLKKYLERYPYGCTEQITSAAFCRLLLNDNGEPALPTATLQKQMDHTFNVLASRQSPNGSLGGWYADNFEGLDYFSPHVAMLCLQARELGITVPETLEQPLLDYIRRVSGRQPLNLWELRNLAYMLYVRARHGDQVTPHLLNLQDIIQKNYRELVESDIFTPLIAAAHKLMHNHQAADALMDQFQPGKKFTPRTSAYIHWGDYYHPLSRDSFYLALTAMHFPERLTRLGGGWIDLLIQPINAGNFNTNSAAMSTLALAALTKAAAAMPPQKLTLTAITPGGEKTAEVSGNAVLTARLPAEVEKLRVQILERTLPALYVQTTQTGFPLTVPAHEENNGLQVTRIISTESDPALAKEAVATATLGDDLYVHITLRSTGADDLQNIAIVDLLPAGFEIPRSDLTSGPGNIQGVDYIELREDRAIFYCTAPSLTARGGGSRKNPLTITYRVKPTATGVLQVPPIYAESMYDAAITSIGKPSQITVVKNL